MPEPQAPQAAQAAPVPALDALCRPVAAAVLGASAGGVEAFMRVLVGLPADFTLPVIAVLHLPNDRRSQLAELFRPRLALAVAEARDKEPIAASTVYFAPAGYHLSVERDRSFSLSGEAPVHYARPSIDVLMASAADAYGPHVVGILMTGANADGAAGLACIRQAGGLTVVQDPAQAQMPAMPQAAIRCSKPDAVLSLADIHLLLRKLGAPT